MPMTTKHACRIGGDPPMNCPGPCPTEPNPSWTSQATYARGSSYKVTWARNNHEGGFTRLTLVPKDLWTSRAAHDERAFWYSCWSAGREACTASNKDIGNGGRCYDDKDGSRFGTTITVPRVVPDGDYVLGYAWFGGLGSDFRSSFLGDYYDCAVVTVQGGAPVQAEEAVVFQPGAGSQFGDQCESVANKLGVCPSEPCEGKTKSLMKPASFEGGTPAPLTAALYGGTPAAAAEAAGGGQDAAAAGGPYSPGQAPKQEGQQQQQQKKQQEQPKPQSGQYAPGQAAPKASSPAGQQPPSGPYKPGQAPSKDSKPAGQAPQAGQYKPGQAPEQQQKQQEQQQPQGGPYQPGQAPSKDSKPAGQSPQAGQSKPGQAPEQQQKQQSQQQPQGGPYQPGQAQANASQPAGQPSAAAPSRPPAAGAPDQPDGGAAAAPTPDEGGAAAPAPPSAGNLGVLGIDGLLVVDVGSGTVTVASEELLASGVAASTTSTLVAAVRGPANYVEFFVNGAWAHTESFAPYSIAGDAGGAFTPWTELHTSGRSVSVHVKVYDVARNSVERTFNFPINP